MQGKPFVSRLYTLEERYPMTVVIANWWVQIDRYQFLNNTELLSINAVQGVLSIVSFCLDSVRNGRSVFS